MSGLFGASLLVSLPGSQLGALNLPGSLFAWRDLRDALLAPDLRLALDLVVQAAGAAGTALRFVARPEIFTDGASRTWLNERLGDAQDHLILTDGDTLRPLPGLRNHMFFYARGVPEREARLRRLLGVAPELLAAMASQLNGTAAVKLEGGWIRPPARALGHAVTPRGEPALVAPFLCHPGNPGKSAALSAEAVEEASEATALDRPAHYIQLSESALADPTFMEPLTRLLPRAALGSHDQVVLLGLPPLGSAEVSLEDRIAPVLRAMSAAGMPFVRVDFSCIPRWGVRFVTAPPEPAELAGGTLTLHPATAFWRLGADLFAAAGRVEILAEGRVAAFHALLSEWLGAGVRLHRAHGAQPDSRL